MLTNRKRAGVPGIMMLVLIGGLFVADYFQEKEVYSSLQASSTPSPPAREAMFYTKLDDMQVQCHLCFRECVIPQGERGFCRNRENRDGTLYSIVYGKPSAVQIDPIEKEPMHHFLPGTQILCIGTAGCNLTCQYCHNWALSQSSIEELRYYSDASPHQIVETAISRGIPTISFTYNEPTTAYEYLYDVARLAKSQGLNMIFHSNGTMSPEPLKELLKYIDGVTIDIKGFSEEFYRDMSEGQLQPVLKTLKIIKDHNVWLELVNLVVPGYNDAPEQIRAMCQWIYTNLGPDVPLHFSRFFPSYQLTRLAPTPISTLEEAYTIARDAGLNYVSVGNVPGHPKNSTFCDHCSSVLIHRVHFSVQTINLTQGTCGECGHHIPGVWQ